VAALSLGTGVWIGWPFYQEWVRDDAARIQLQYNPMLIDVEEGSLVSGSQVVDVGSFQDLTKLAERYGAVILHEGCGGSHRYFVQNGDVVYQYSLEVCLSDSIFPDHTALKQAVKQAVTEGELQLYYQPVYSLRDNKIVGLEALLRWEHPRHGVLCPAEFIPQAEESGLIEQIDWWVLQTACQQLKSWQEAQLPLVPLSLNISTDVFVQPDCVAGIMDIIDASGCQPQYLQLEISRANLISQDEDVIACLQRLKDMGISLAIDNFATSGANQIDHIAWLPANSLKIDRSVVQRVLQSPRDTLLVSAVAKMARSLEMEVIAQGVETQDQMTFLQSERIDQAQGYLLSHPIPADQVPALLTTSGTIQPQLVGGEL
jgi:EAL domain-containing protein (putative c-di-GMP-specific phosphodiesterase class I)